MSESEDQNLLKIAQKVNLDNNDLKEIKKSHENQRFQYWKAAIFSFFIGFLGGWIFLSPKDDVNNAGYPISQILIGISFTSHMHTSRIGKTLILTASLIIIALTGFVSGGASSVFLQPSIIAIVPSPSPLYAVHYNQGA